MPSQYYGGELEKNRGMAIARLVVFSIVMIMMFLFVVAHFVDKDWAWTTFGLISPKESVIIVLGFAALAGFIAVLLMGKEIIDMAKLAFRTGLKPTVDAFKYAIPNVRFAVTGEHGTIPMEKLNITSWTKEATR